MPKTMFDIIKKQNGEKFAKAIRNYDNGIFDVPDLDKIVKYAGREAEPIMNYLVSLKNIKIAEMSVHQDPIMLLDRAGYDAYVVHNLDEQNAIQKYFEPGEELCTFRDSHRFEKYYIINAVRKDVDKIRRDDFNIPQREDAYGTSVISIQVLKSGGFISIKNRYNHTVQNPDNTFDSNPDNIIPGLADAIKHYFNADFSAQRVELPDNYMMLGDQIIRYNVEAENTYIGDDFYVRDGIITEINKDYEIILDTLLFNTKTKEFTSIAAAQGDYDAIDILTNELHGKKITIQKQSDGSRAIMADETPIVGFKDGQMVLLNLPTTQFINDDCFKYCHGLTELNAPELTDMQNACFAYNEKISKLNLPKLQVMGNLCFNSNSELRSLDLPRLSDMGSGCFSKNHKIVDLNMPALMVMEDECFAFAPVKDVNLPMLEYMGNECLRNRQIQTINMPKLTEMGLRCFRNSQIKKIDLPNLKKMGGECFYSDTVADTLNLPMLETMGWSCFYNGGDMSELNLPNLVKMQAECFKENISLTKVNLPKLQEMNYECFSQNVGISELNLPELVGMGNWCFFRNRGLVELNLPNVVEMGRGCFRNNKMLRKINMPQVKRVGIECFHNNHDVRTRLEDLSGPNDTIKDGGVIINITPDKDVFKSGAMRLENANKKQKLQRGKNFIESNSLINNGGEYDR